MVRTAIESVFVLGVSTGFLRAELPAVSRRAPKSMRWAGGARRVNRVTLMLEERFMLRIPRDKSLVGALALAFDGYEFISKRCRPIKLTFSKLVSCSGSSSA